MTHHLDTLLTAHLRRTGETLSGLAAKTGISRGYLSALKNNRNPNAPGEALDPSVAILRKLAKGMGMSLEKLLYLAGITDSEAVEADLDKLPEDARRALIEMGVDYLAVTREMETVFPNFPQI